MGAAVVLISGVGEWLRADGYYYGSGCFLMTEKDRKSGASGKAADPVFDLWLRKGLHQLFDDVASEPVPQELLDLIEQSRGKPD
ncbi:NepR family anti-sigma factor [Acetobacter sp. AN02]|uniref:NepR family anti-sigma factor n=1 Tax=Acetobacter sp. AN02 TaxID=2894186 RepID=UPI00325FCEAD